MIKAIRRASTQRVSYKVELTPVALSLDLDTNCSQVELVAIRGNNKNKVRSCGAAPWENGSASWDAKGGKTVSFTATMFREKSGCVQPKPYKLVVLAHKKGSARRKAKSLAAFELDVGRFAGHGSDGGTLQLFAVKCQDENAKLTCKVKVTFAPELASMQSFRNVDEPEASYSTYDGSDDDIDSDSGYAPSKSNRAFSGSSANVESSSGPPLSPELQRGIQRDRSDSNATSDNIENSSRQMSPMSDIDFLQRDENAAQPSKHSEASPQPQQGNNQCNQKQPKAGEKENTPAGTVVSTANSKTGSPSGNAPTAPEDRKSSPGKGCHIKAVAAAVAAAVRKRDEEHVAAMADAVTRAKEEAKVEVEASRARLVAVEVQRDETAVGDTDDSSSNSKGRGRTKAKATENKTKKTRKKTKTKTTKTEPTSVRAAAVDLQTEVKTAAAVTSAVAIAVGTHEVCEWNREFAAAYDRGDVRGNGRSDTRTIAIAAAVKAAVAEVEEEARVEAREEARERLREELRTEIEAETEKEVDRLLQVRLVELGVLTGEGKNIEKVVAHDGDGDEHGDGNGDRNGYDVKSGSAVTLELAHTKFGDKQCPAVVHAHAHAHAVTYPALTRAAREPALPLPLPPLQRNRKRSGTLPTSEQEQIAATAAAVAEALTTRDRRWEAKTAKAAEVIKQAAQKADAEADAATEARLEAAVKAAVVAAVAEKESQERTMFFALRQSNTLATAAAVEAAVALAVETQEKQLHAEHEEQVRQKLLSQSQQHCRVSSDVLQRARRDIERTYAQGLRAAEEESARARGELSRSNEEHVRDREERERRYESALKFAVTEAVTREVMEHAEKMAVMQARCERADEVKQK